ncbi:siderophore biosynthesis protein [Nodularia spumigena CENA596]|uniref:Siderophore biosynthesis protein n=1 Tax=Nodularia spumigena CENA596 TaxID=1819295 RepID=A0A166JT37_NODSP|nr:LLM class flavin-dependent oxidoreductase [Nodularia spumigena]KZL50092.1 siderophore biosynthesis protein [Nodularia spumigena CENA596]
MDFSLFYFDGDGSVALPNQYQLLIKSAKFADANGFTAVWTPERHFHAFGGLYPNPALTSAALAMITKRIQLRAGSFVLPLHDPVRATEEWSVVDNLSDGRVAIAFASGWTVDDFVLAREPHSNRKAVMWRDLEVMRTLWRGDAVERQDATGKTFTVKTLPRPVQAELPMWMTCQSSETFVDAGKLGSNVLTSLLGGNLDDIVPKIQLYRKSLAKHGHDPQGGKVALMIHTFLGDDINDVKAKVTQPFCNYLKTHYDLLENLAKGMGLNVSIKNFSEDDIDSLLQFGVEGFMKGRSLIGTPESCRPFVEQIRAAGVDEIACLIDFVQDYDLVMASLPFVSKLQQQLTLSLCK